MPSSQSSTPCGRCKVLRDQLYTVGDERDRAIETRENANAVSIRAEAENRRLREALDEAIELLKRWQYNDTTSPGPVEETGEFLERAHYAPERHG